MGNSQVKESVCVSLENYPNLTSPSYSVKRTGGNMDGGWVIRKSPFSNLDESYSWLNMHASKHIADGWRIFMHNNNKDPNLYACGWRRIETIVPENQDADFDQEKWYNDLVNILERLEEARLSRFSINAYVES
jgi:hypothetical protein